jgi:hypothetical protein
MWAGWAGMVLGLMFGAFIGLRFHEEGFAGGYGAFRRRMLRLAHIAFFGIGIINVLYALTLESAEVIVRYPVLASTCLALAVILMPLLCILTAWKSVFRHGFAVPVICVAIPLILLLEGMVHP